MKKRKKFSLTLHFVSCRLPSWLASEVTNDLLYRQQALFKTQDYIEGDEGVGFQFNVKKPLDIAEKLPVTEPGQMKISNLGKIGFYLYLPQETCKYFREKKGVDAKIPCSYKNGWLRLYYLRKHRRPTLDSAFKA